MPPKKVVKTKKAPAYQPDEEYLHSLVCAEVAIQLEKKKQELTTMIDVKTAQAYIRNHNHSKVERECHPLTWESKKEHYFSMADIVWSVIVGALLWFTVWALVVWSL